MADVQQQVEELKGKGNTALTEGNTDEAVQWYTQGIQLDPLNHVLFSNRSAAYCKASEFTKALDDAEMVIKLKPDWPKGYSRKGTSLSCLNRHEEAMGAYEDGLQLNPDNEQLKKGMKECESYLIGPAGSQEMLNPFADARLWQKLRDNPTTADYMKDPSFKMIMETLHKSPKELGKYMQDPRVMSTLGVLLGVQLDRPSGDRSSGDGLFSSVNSEYHQQKSKNASACQNSSNTQANGRDEPMEAEQTDTKQEALAAKEEGNAAYKKKDFETAMSHYNRAVEMDPENIVYRNNRAAVYFEQGDYDRCIKECEEAVDVGRENRADYKLIAKAFARIGNAYSKQEDYTKALTYYQKSLSEHRDKEIVKKSLHVEKIMKEEERLAYINPEMSLQEKDQGNAFFKNGDYPNAIKHYTEAIKRNPEDPKIYSNRAACFTKLAEFAMALKDSDECIKLDPKFVKGYLRKGASLVAMKKFSKAADVYQKAMDIDPNCQEAIEGYRRALVAEGGDPEVVRERAMQDPEVQEILGDPAMQLILQQMQKDPKALHEHLRNPQIAKKIEKLMESGLIAIR